MKKASISRDVEKIKNEISLFKCAENICCILLYGSALKKTSLEDIKDTDIIIVLDDIKSDITELFDYIFKNFHDTDFHLYAIAEIEGDLSYFTREYVLEYLSKGVCLYGENIFQNKFKEVTKQQYTESILIRSIEHTQMVRKIYFSEKYNLEYKTYYVKKYIVRLAKNILLYKGIMDYDRLDELTNEEVIRVLINNNLLDKRYDLPWDDHLKQVSIGLYYDLFCEIGTNLLNCRTELL